MFEDNEKLQEGTIVDIQIPFSYTIGEPNPVTGEVMETVADCKQAVIDEIDAGNLITTELVFGDIEVTDSM